MAEKEQNEIARLFLDVFSSPELHLLSMQADSGDATFVRMTRDTYKRSPFLFKRIVRPDTVSLNVRLDGLLELAAARAPESPSPGYVFHIAYTCSTLIANCLAEAENCLVLKEPYALHQLSRLKYDVRSR
ncbi:MAG TPA: hypothetical protein VM598_02070, partial [Bdellovibrionota bacterium]|nr:hypothetical protein [Bdellovibrionota bacterium]